MANLSRRLLHQGMTHRLGSTVPSSSPGHLFLPTPGMCKFLEDSVLHKSHHWNPRHHKKIIAKSWEHVGWEKVERVCDEFGAT